MPLSKYMYAGILGFTSGQYYHLVLWFMPTPTRRLTRN